MASIKKRGENTYLITVSNGYRTDGKKITQTKTVKLDKNMTAKQREKELAQIAMRFEDEVKVQNISGSSVTFETFVNRWLKEHAEVHLELKTISSYKKELSSKIIPAIGHIKLNKLQPLHLTQFLNSLTEDGKRLDGKPGSYSSRTIKYCHQIISSILSSAVHWNILQENIAKRVKPPKGAPKVHKINYFDEKQAMVFLRYIENEPLKYKVLTHIAIYGGLRLEEVLPLLWTDIDFERYTIDINKATSYVDRTQFVKDTAKNTSSTRKITLPAHVFALLSELKKQMPGTNVFDFHYSTPSHWIAKTIKKYNSENTDKLPTISFHGLRHTSATLLISQKVDVRTVAGRLGHQSPTTTLNIYSHYLKSRDESASETLGNLLSDN